MGEMMLPLLLLVMVVLADVAVVVALMVGVGVLWCRGTKIDKAAVGAPIAWRSGGLFEASLLLGIVQLNVSDEYTILFLCF